MAAGIQFFLLPSGTSQSKTAGHVAREVPKVSEKEFSRRVIVDVSFVHPRLRLPGRERVFRARGHEDTSRRLIDWSFSLCQSLMSLLGGVATWWPLVSSLRARATPTSLSVTIARRGHFFPLSLLTGEYNRRCLVSQRVIDYELPKARKPNGR